MRDGVYRGAAPCERAYTRAGDCVAGVRSTGTQSPALWGAFTGDWFDRGSIGNASGYSLRTAEVVAGFDRKITHNSFAGFAFGYDNAYQKFDAFEAVDTMNVFRLMLYGGMKRGDVYADGYIGYTKNWHKTRRDTHLASTGFQHHGTEQV